MPDKPRAYCGTAPCMYDLLGALNGRCFSKVPCGGGHQLQAGHGAYLGPRPPPSSAQPCQIMPCTSLLVVAHGTHVCGPFLPAMDAAPALILRTLWQAHTDEGLITLLVTSPNSAGLQLAAGKDGKALDSRQGLFEVTQCSASKRPRASPYTSILRWPHCWKGAASRNSTGDTSAAVQVEAWHPCPHKPGCIVVRTPVCLRVHATVPITVCHTAHRSAAQEPLLACRSMWATRCKP